MKRIFPLIAISLLTWTACVGPDDKSGGDSERYTAKAAQVGQAVAGKVDYAGGDRTDWLGLTAPDPGILKIQLIVDNDDAEVGIELYDRYGKYLSRVTRRKDGQKQVMLLQEITPGKYFIKVYARKKHDKTGYTIMTGIMGS